jgi:serine/threonine protein kinase
LRLLSRFEFIYELEPSRVRHMVSLSDLEASVFLIPALVEINPQLSSLSTSRRYHPLIEKYHTRASMIFHRSFFFFPQRSPDSQTPKSIIPPFGLLGLILTRLMRASSDFELLEIRPDGSFVLAVRQGYTQPVGASGSLQSLLVLPVDMGPAPPPPDGVTPHTFDEYFVMECKRNVTADSSAAHLELILRKPTRSHSASLTQPSFLLALASGVISHTALQFFNIDVEIYFHAALGARAIRVRDQEIFDALLSLNDHPLPPDNICVAFTEPRRVHHIPVVHFAPDLLLYEISQQLALLTDVSFSPEMLFSSAFLNVHLGSLRITPATFIVIRSNMANDSAEDRSRRTQLLKCFFFETVQLARLNHPNIVALIAYTLHPQSMALELCEFGSLEFLLDGQRALQQPINPTIAFSLALDIAAGMNYLHQLDILHTRLTPRSIHLARPTVASSPSPMRAKICGFGPLSRQVFYYHEELESLKRRIWSAPELFQGEYQRHVSPTRASDVYAFGLLLFCLFSNADPFESFGISSTQLLEEFLIAGGRPHIPPDTPPAIAMLIADCWQEFYDQRPSFTTILSILEPVASVLTPCGLPPAIRGMPPPRPSESLIEDDGSIESEAVLVLRESWARTRPSHPATELAVLFADIEEETARVSDDD